MFLSTILVALIVGALAGGGLPRLANLHLRWSVLLIIALGLRLAAGLSRELDFTAGWPFGWAYVAAYAFILGWLWFNWRVPGLQIAAVGIGANMLAVLINEGRMPIWSAAFTAAGFSFSDVANDPFHFILETDTIAGFVAGGGLFGDVVPLPLPIIRDVVSIGDLLLALGIFWAIVYSMTRPEAPSRAAFALGSNPVIRPGAAGAGTIGVPYSGPSRIPAEVSMRAAEDAGVRRQSPYLRLVENRNFSLLWVGQLVSLFGERIHTVALAFLVLEATGSAVEVGLTFAATAIPNVVLGPLAGALVDRWDRRLTMLACDILRAILLVSVPFVIDISIGLIYVMAFLIATVTLLFRPAKTAVIPAVVEERDLVTANSMSSVADTAADLVGLPVAGILVAVLIDGQALELAFLLGGVTYLVSALLIFFMSVPREELISTPFRPRAVWDEMVEGWNFLRRQAELFSNTLVSTVAQLAVGAEIVASVPYARRILDSSRMDPEQTYALLLTAVALGSVLGGLAVGAIGERIAKGPLIIAGFIGMGLSLAIAGLVTDPFVAIGIFFFTGLANMLFIIPTITLFQQRTPQRLMGRVVSSRQALVFGAIALSMGLSGWLSELIGADTVLMVAGGICALSGAAGIFVPAMRNAR
ncbi:MAG: MFS transporter [Candidatus Limnocylindria bacterium]